MKYEPLAANEWGVKNPACEAGFFVPARKRAPPWSQGGSGEFPRMRGLMTFIGKPLCFSSSFPAGGPLRPFFSCIPTPALEGVTGTPLIGGSYC
ncbi:hypothetical protein D9M69_577290 [compost metagenome]